MKPSQLSATFELIFKSIQDKAEKEGAQYAPGSIDRCDLYRQAYVEHIGRLQHMLVSLCRYLDGEGSELLDTHIEILINAVNKD